MPSQQQVQPERRKSAERRTGVERRSAPDWAMQTQFVGVADPPEVPYAAEIRRLANLDLPEAEAARHWRAIEHLREALRRRLGRDVGLVVTALDYFLNARHDLQQPTIVERSVLDAVERKAITDRLTGAFNRQHFEATLLRELERAARYSGALSLALLDVDDLKLVNDRHGHLVGDEALRRVAAALQQELRGVDVACRFGGDEFALILPGTDLAGAARVVARIGVACEQSFTETPLAATPPTRVSVSGGIATYRDDGTSEMQLLAAADRALYLAKRRGKTRSGAPTS